MSFPLDPLDVHVEALIDGVWEDLGSFADPEPLDATNRLTADPITIRRGRQDESQRVSPGQFSFRAWNDDGLLTPNEESDWWRTDGTGWDLGTQVRVRVGSNVRMHGEVSQITIVYPVGDISDGAGEAGVCFVDVTVSGILRRLQQRSKPLRSVLSWLATHPVYLPSVSGYFPMEDGAGSTMFASGLVGGQPMQLTGRVQFAADELLVGSEPLPTVGAGDTANWFGRLENGFADDGAVECFVRRGTRPESGSMFRLIEVFTTGTLSRWTVEEFLFTRPCLRVRAYDSVGELSFQYLLNLDDDWGWYTDAPLQVVLTLNQDGGNVDWGIFWWNVDYRESFVPYNGPGFPPVYYGATGSWAGTVGTATAIGGAAINVSGGATIGHLIAHEPLPQHWLWAGAVGAYKEPAGARLARVCGAQTIPITFTTGSDTRTTAMGPDRAISLPDKLRECEDADRGILRERRDAVSLHYVTRRSRYNRPPKLTLDAAESEIDNPFAPTRDDQRIRNEVTAQMLDGPKATEVDAASQERFGVYDEQITINTSNELELRHQAGWQLHIGADDGIRYGELTVDLAKAPSKRGAVSAVDTGDVIRVTNLPPQQGETSVDLIAEGYTETLEPYGRRVVFNCSPGDVWTVAVWGVSLWDDGSILGL